MADMANRKKPRTREEDARLLRLRLLPAFGNKMVASLMSGADGVRLSSATDCGPIYKIRPDTLTMKDVRPTMSSGEEAAGVGLAPRAVPRYSHLRSFGGYDKPKSLNFRRSIFQTCSHGAQRERLRCLDRAAEVLQAKPRSTEIWD